MGGNSLPDNSRQDTAMKDSAENATTAAAIEDVDMKDISANAAIDNKDEHHDNDAEDDADGDADEGQDDDDQESRDRLANKAFLQQIHDLTTFLSEYKNEEGQEVAAGFQRIPNKRAVPDYRDTIPNPIAFSTIRNKTLRKQYTTFTEFVHDVAQICHNAQVYNRSTAPIFHAANQLRDVLRLELQKLVETGSISNQEAQLPDLGQIPNEDEDDPEDDEEEGEEEDDEDAEDDNSDDQEKDATAKNRRGRATAIKGTPNRKRGRPSKNTSARKVGRKSQLGPSSIKDDAEGEEEEEDDGGEEEEEAEDEDGNSHGNNNVNGNGNSRRRGRPPKISTPLDARIHNILQGLRHLTASDGQLLMRYFQKLPDKTAHEDYYQVIKEPVAMDQIVRKYQRRRYNASNGGGEVDGLMSDLGTMFKNAQMYNEDGSDIWKAATALWQQAQILAQQEKSKSDAELGVEPAAVVVAASPAGTMAAMSRRSRGRKESPPPPPLAASSRVAARGPPSAIDATPSFGTPTPAYRANSGQQHPPPSAFNPPHQYHTQQPHNPNLRHQPQLPPQHMNGHPNNHFIHPQQSQPANSDPKFRPMQPHQQYQPQLQHPHHNQQQQQQQHQHQHQHQQLQHSQQHLQHPSHHHNHHHQAPPPATPQHPQHPGYPQGYVPPYNQAPLPTPQMHHAQQHSAQPQRKSHMVAAPTQTHVVQPQIHHHHQQQQQAMAPVYDHHTQRGGSVHAMPAVPISTPSRSTITAVAPPPPQQIAATPTISQQPLAPRPADVYVLPEASNNEIPDEVRKIFHRDDNDRLLLFHNPPLNRPEDGIALESRGLAHSVRYLADKSREKQKKKDDGTLPDRQQDVVMFDQEADQQQQQQQQEAAQLQTRNTETGTISNRDVTSSQTAEVDAGTASAQEFVLTQWTDYWTGCQAQLSQWRTEAAIDDWDEVVKPARTQRQARQLAMQEKRGAARAEWQAKADATWAAEERRKERLGWPWF